MQVVTGEGHRTRMQKSFSCYKTLTLYLMPFRKLNAA